MDKASDYESGDSRFESWQGRFLQWYSFLIISFLSPNMSIFTSFLGLNAKKKYIYRYIYYIDSLDRGIFGQNFGSLRYDFILESS